MIIKENYSLKHLNSFGLDVSANYFAEVYSVADIRELMRLDEYRKDNVFILGGGSNVLLTKNLDALTVHNRIPGIEMIEEDGDYAVLNAGAGEVWHDLVSFAVDAGYGGIENLSLIPGYAGAAPIQNIGAYGVELKDVFLSLTAIDLASGEMRIFDNASCQFGYRNSIFKNELKGRFIITGIKLRLSRSAAVNTSYGAIEQELLSRGVQNPDFRAVSDAVSGIRRSKLPDPAVIGNAGSFFKNPLVSSEKLQDLKKEYAAVVSYPAENGKFKLAAGWLIEACGWKGKVVGNTGTHKDQALVIVNHGNASGIEIYNLSEQIVQSVKKKFGIELEREVNVL